MITYDYPDAIRVDPNGTRITQALSADRCASSVQLPPSLHLLVEPHPACDQPLGYPPRVRQPRIRLRPPLHRSWLVPVRAIADPLANDQLQQPRQVPRDPTRVVQVARLERPHRMQRPLEAEPPRDHSPGPRSLRHDP